MGPNYKASTIGGDSTILLAIYRHCELAFEREKVHPERQSKTKNFFELTQREAVLTAKLLQIAAGRAFVTNVDSVSTFARADENHFYRQKVPLNRIYCTKRPHINAT